MGRVSKETGMHSRSSIKPIIATVKPRSSITEMYRMEVNNNMGEVRGWWGTEWRIITKTFTSQTCIWDSRFKIISKQNFIPFSQKQLLSTGMNHLFATSVTWIPAVELANKSGTLLQNAPTYLGTLSSTPINDASSANFSATMWMYIIHY